jgi:hypothetical protein
MVYEIRLFDTLDDNELLLLSSDISDNAYL